jgi:hypothetical protein
MEVTLRYKIISESCRYVVGVTDNIQSFLLFQLNVRTIVNTCTYTYMNIQYISQIR